MLDITSNVAQAVGDNDLPVDAGEVLRENGVEHLGDAGGFVAAGNDDRNRFSVRHAFPFPVILRIAAL